MISYNPFFILYKLGLPGILFMCLAPPFFIINRVFTITGTVVVLRCSIFQFLLRVFLIYLLSTLSDYLFALTYRLPGIFPFRVFNQYIWWITLYISVRLDCRVVFLTSVIGSGYYLHHFFFRFRYSIVFTYFLWIYYNIFNVFLCTSLVSGLGIRTISDQLIVFLRTISLIVSWTQRSWAAIINIFVSTISPALFSSRVVFMISISAFLIIFTSVFTDCSIQSVEASEYFV